MTAQMRARERYLDTALEMIDRAGGSQGLTLRELARALGCAHTNAYNDFSSLNDLLAQALVVALRRQVEEAERALGAAGAAPARRLERLVGSQVDFALAHPGWYRLVWVEPLRGALPPQALALMERAGAELTQLVAAASGAPLPSAEARWLAEDLHTWLHGALCKALAGRVRSPAPARIRREILAGIDRLLRRSTTRPGRR